MLNLVFFMSEKSCIVDFVTRFTHDSTPHNNFSCRNSYLYKNFKCYLNRISPQM